MHAHKMGRSEGASMTCTLTNSKRKLRKKALHEPRRDEGACTHDWKK